MKLLIYTLVCLLLIGCNNDVFIKPPTGEKYYIPEHIEQFVIIHNQSEGQNILDGDVRIFSISDNGVLKVQSPRDTDWHNKEFFQIRNGLDTIPLLHEADQTKKQHKILLNTPDSIVVFGMQWNEPDSSSIGCHYSSFCIGKVKNSEYSPPEVWKKFNISMFCNSQDSIMTISYPDTLNYTPDKSIGYISHFDTATNLLEIRLYKYLDEKWKLIQTLDSIDSHWGDDEIELLDYNFDGHLDIRIFIGTGARGGNQFFSIYLWRPEINQFSILKGGKDIPNLEPDTSCHCVKAMALSGSSHFLTYLINVDSLVLKRAVNVSSSQDGWTYRRYYTYDGEGVEKLMSIDSIHDEGASAFSEEP